MHIAACFLRRIEDVLEGSDPGLFTQALRAADLSARGLATDQMIRLDQLVSVQLFLRRLHPDITLRLYQAADLSDLGLMGYAMTTCGTVRKAFEIAIKYHDLTSDRYQLELLEYEDVAVVRQQPFLEHLGDYQDLAEELSGVCRILQILLADRVDLSRIKIRFNYPTPAHASSYQELLPGPCSFESEHSEVRFPRGWLDYELSAASTTPQIGLATCDRLLGPSDFGASIQDAVKRLLVTRTGRQMPTLDQAAGELRLSVSQLRRRLYKENTSYKQVLLAVRMTLARHYLGATSLSVQEIAFLLDYSQAAPFSRAFKTYFGFSPQGSRAA
jgi:AraC-like DNA-binding protein